MTTRETHLNTYAQGWVKGDPEVILQACAPEYQFVDNGNPVLRSRFATYLTELKSQLGMTSDPFMEISNVVAREIGDLTVACCYWKILGTEIAGTGLIVVESDGVSFEEVSY